MRALIDLRDLFLSTSLLVKVTLVLSLISFITSLTQPAFYIDRADPDAWADSLGLLLLGWMSLLGGGLIPFIIWMANPMYVFSIVYALKRKSDAIAFAASATVLALIFSQLDTIITSESGAHSAITERALGFKLWFLSFVILTLGLFVNYLIQRREIYNS